MAADGVTILDGGMGRELLRIGAPFRQPEWSALALLEGPDYVRRFHDSFGEHDDLWGGWLTGSLAG